MFPITKIAVSNINSIKDEITIDFSPLTLLYGRNMSGKSSAMKPLLVLQDICFGKDNTGGDQYFSVTIWQVGKFNHFCSPIGEKKDNLIGKIADKDLIMSLRSIIYLSAQTKVNETGTNIKDNYPEIMAYIIRMVGAQNLNADLELLDVGQVLISENTLKLKLKSGNMIDVLSVGDGMSHMLAIITALNNAIHGQLVYLDHPETFLDAQSCIALAEIISNAVHRGVRVVVESQSRAFLLRVQTLVAKGILNPKEVCLNWFSLDESGETKVTAGTIDQCGAYGEWPEDLDLIELRNDNDFFDANAEAIRRDV